MTLPTSCTPARLAVEHALTTVTGAHRGLATGQIFRLMPPAYVTRNPADLKRVPGVFVLFRDPVLDGEMENGSSITIHHVVRIYCDYWMGSDSIRAEFEAARSRLEADGNRMRAALCSPGALATSPAGDDTGLFGHALRSDAYSASGPDPLPTSPDSSDRVMRVVHTFRASIDTLQP